MTGPMMGASPTPPDTGAGFAPSQLAGFPAAPPVDPAQAQAQALEATISRFRSMEEDLRGIASQFPVAAAEVAKAIDAVRDVLKRVVSTPAGPEPPAPRVLG